jgi:diguanylate cyclase (GGDEF)-like protein
MNKSDKITACLEVGKLLTSTLNLQEILQLIMQKVSQLVDAENWSLLLKDNATGELTFEIVEGENKEILKGHRLPPGKSIVSSVVESGVPVILKDAKADPRFNESIDSMTRFRTGSIICIPLTIYGEVLGAIEIINVRDIETFRAEELPVLSILADYAAIAIKNSHYVAKIQRMSIMDEYTGLYNARYLHRILDDMILQAGRKCSHLSVVFVDLDNFKEVVDTYGHLSGTRVLKEIGETISACLSEEDVLIKYGGDEYVILIPGADKRTALAKTESILQAIRVSEYLKSESKPVRLTASFGIAVYPVDATTKTELLIRADNSMYKIKKTRKNGVGII